MKRLILKSIIFVFTLLVLLCLADGLFIDKTEAKITAIDSFYKAETGTVDVLMLGSSHLRNGIDPVIFERETNLRSEMIFGMDITIDQIYLNLKTSLKVHSPKLVIIETWPLISSGTAYNQVRRTNDVLALANNEDWNIKYKSLRYRNLIIERRNDHFYPIFNAIRYHDFWVDSEKFYRYLPQPDTFQFKLNLQSLQKKIPALSPYQISKFRKKEFSAEFIDLSADKSYLLKKIIYLSVEHDFQLLFVTVPIYDVYFDKTKEGFERVHNKLEAYIKGYPKVGHYDINWEHGGFDATLISKDRRISHNQHLNYKGILKTTHLLATYIANNTPQVDVQKDYVQLSYFDKHHLDRTKKDPAFEGAIFNINGDRFQDSRIKNTIRINGDKPLKIEGWMLHTGGSDSNSVKMIGLVRNGKMSYLSSNNLVESYFPQLENRKNVRYLESGYSVFIRAGTLEKGKYKIYHILKALNDTVFVKDMWKWIHVDY